MSSSTGVKKDAFSNYGIGANMSNQLGGNAQNIYGSLAPTLTSQMVHPQGYTPNQKAAMNTASQQSAGGSNAGAVGQGALLAARTRNAGAAQNAVQQSARGANENLSDAALRTEMGNANLQQRQQENATKGLEGLYNSELGGSQNALGLSNQSLKVASEAPPSFWQQFAQQAGGDALKAAFGLTGA